MLKPTLAISVLALALSACTTTQIVKPEHAHAYSHDHHHNHDHGWDYAHPEKWGDLEVNKLCGTGVEQSPINIDTVVKPRPDSQGNFTLTPSYTASDFEVENNGHTIVFNVKDDKNTLNVNGVDYKLLQFHYHVPSEHTVMNAFYPLEIHFVHQNANGGLAVVGVLVEKGATNADLGKILTDLPKDGKYKGTLSAFDVSTIMPKDSKTYAYNGSLTTPPCSEQVQWLLQAKPISADSKQLNTLAKLYNGNNRPVQPQGDRTVYMVE